MSDLQLRRRERTAAVGGGGAEERAALLAARLRAGKLEPTRLRLAAYADDLAAQSVSGEPAPPRDLEGWVRGLARWGQEACARAAVALADVALPVWESWEPGVFAPGSHVRGARDAAQALLLVRSEAAWQVADEALVAAEDALERARFHLAAIELDHPGAVRASSWKGIDAGWAAVCAARAAVEHLRGPEGRPDGAVAPDLVWAVGELEHGVASRAHARAALAQRVRAWAAPDP